MARKKISKNYLLLLVALGIFLIPALVSAVGSVTLATPAQDATIYGSSYNITTTLTQPNLICNVTYYYKTATGTTWTILASQANTSANQTSFSYKLDTSTITSAKDYVFNISVSNESYKNPFIFSDTSTGVDVDNVNPVAALTLSVERTEFLDPIGFSYDCSASADNCDGDLTYSVVWTKADGSTVTKTTSTGTFDDDDLNVKGAGDVVCTITDNAAHSVSSSKQYVLVGDGKAKAAQSAWEQATSTVSTKTGLALIIVFVLIAGFVIVIALTQSGGHSKRRRRR